MKKITLALAITLLGLIPGHAQGEFSIGGGLGIPVFDISNRSDFAVNFDAAYLFEVAEGVDLGPSVSYLMYFSSVGALKDVSYLPIALQGKWEFTDDWRLGLETGYGIALTDPFDGGFYWSPRVSFEAAEGLEIVSSLRVINESGFSVGSVNFGVNFTFGAKEEE